MMRRLLPALLALVLGVSVAITLWGRPNAPEQVYSVADVTAGLKRQPNRWVGRTVLVRGTAAISAWATSPSEEVLEPCYSLHRHCTLIEPHGRVVYLVLAPWGGPDLLGVGHVNPGLAMWAFLRAPYVVLRVQPASPTIWDSIVQRVPSLFSFLFGLPRNPGDHDLLGDTSRVYRIHLLPLNHRMCPISTMSMGCLNGDLVSV